MLAALAASAALLLVGAAGAQAKVVELTGTTTFTPSPQATQFLANHGVTVAPTGEATAENGSFVFPIAAGFGNTRTYNGLLAHKGGLKFTKGDRSAVVRNFVAVRVRGAGAVLLAQIPGLRGGCGAPAARRCTPSRSSIRARASASARRRPQPPEGDSRTCCARCADYCSGGRVIVLARLTNLQQGD